MPLPLRSARPFPAPALLLVLLLLGATGVRADDDCSYQLDADLSIAPERVEIDDPQLGRIEIGPHGELAIDGEDIDLDAGQRASLNAWATQLRQVVPAVVDIALQGVEIGVTAVSEVFAGLVGGEPPEGVRTAIANARAEVAARLGQDGDVWYLHRDGITPGEDAMADVEPLIEDAVKRSVGALLMAAGQRMASGDDSGEASLTSFSERMEHMGDEIEARVQQQSDALERKADLLCAEMRVLEAREETVRRKVPELAALRVLTRGGL